jgi:TRAP-type uncharacterized transport system substrate-binding protein
MDKRVTSIPLEGAIRHRAVIVDIPSEGMQKLIRKREFLADLINNGFYNGLMNCGPVTFDVIKRYEHVNGCWVMELEAIEETNE